MVTLGPLSVWRLLYHVLQKQLPAERRTRCGGLVDSSPILRILCLQLPDCALAKRATNWKSGLLRMADFVPHWTKNRI